MWPSLARFVALAPQGHPRRLRELLEADGGFTICLKSGERVASGVSVATRPARSLRFAPDEWSDRLVDQWVDSIVAEPTWWSAHIGGWIDPTSGVMVLDVVRVMPRPLAWLARPLARLSHQHFVFDLGRRRMVAVS